jgi:hypothetical protein
MSERRFSHIVQFLVELQERANELVFAPREGTTLLFPNHPDPFLEVRVERLDLIPSLTAWCAGYELGDWRSKQLAKHMLRWLPEFALKYSEWSGLDAHNAVELTGKAAASIYLSDKYKKRGEFGEILLHAMIRQRFKSVPAISKYFYKDSNNDTVKGFDAVHVVSEGDDWELWLGEVKFYNNINKAVSDVVDELKDHMERDYLRGEFVAIVNKIDNAWPQAEKLRQLLHENTSLDDVFRCVCVPVLLTYDSNVVGNHSSVCKEYQADFEEEVLKYRDCFASKDLPTNVTVRLFLLPLKQKALLVQQMDEALKACQAALS